MINRSKGKTRHKLLRAKAVCEMYVSEIDGYKERYGHGHVLRFYRERIFPSFIISERMFFYYLAMPYKRELEKIEATDERRN